MAKKIITPEEYKAKQEKRASKRKRFFEMFLKTLAFCLAIALVFSATTIAYTRIAMLTPSEATSTDDGLKDGFEDTGSTDSSTPSTDTGSTDGSTPSGNTGNTGTTDGNKPATPDKNTPSASAADQEILDMYKKGVANARTKSASVIRVRDGAINYKGVVKAGRLTEVAEFLMGMFMASSEDAIQAKNENWEKEKLPDASTLTLNGVQKITREDKGNTYVITVVAKNATNPKTGADGVGSVAGVIEESQITGAIGSVPGLTLEDISIDYENVTAVATIDKATGNCIALDLNAPCFLNIGHAKVPLIGEINNAQVGIQVITEYKISY